MNDLIQRKYKIAEFIGKGKFGSVYRASHIKTGEIVAVKFELSTAPVKILKNETSILNYLYRNGCKSIPFVYWFGLTADSPTLVMTYYDQSLDDYIKENILDIDEKSRIFKVMLNILENIHSHYIIHRDIKPQNFMIRDGELFLIDFGMATTYTDASGNHVEERSGKTDILGTPKYVSIHVHNGFEPSRRDDVISACYIYLSMWLGYLPWDQDKFSVDFSIDINNWRRILKEWENLKNVIIDDEHLRGFLEKSYLISFKGDPVYSL